MSDLSTKTCLILDQGLFPFLATKLAESFGRVLYHTPSTEMFPVARKSLWGSGLPGVERVDDFFDHLDEVDIVVAPDVGCGDLQAWLRKKGYAVWGSGHAEAIETDRVRLKRIMRGLRMPAPKTWIIRGTTALREHLENEDNENQYVKLSTFRGDFETTKHRNWWLSEAWWRDLDHRVGPMREQLEFVVEESIPDAVEIGYDGYCIDGEYPKTAIVGYENKDAGYAGRVCKQKEMPECLQFVNEQLAEVHQELGCRSFFSTEVRHTKDGKSYLIDPTERMPSPPSGAMLETFSNWAEIIYAGAHGELIEPEPIARYMASLILRSAVADDDFMPFRISKEYEHLVKFHGHCKIDGTDYVASIGMDVLGEVVGTGDTLDEACEMACEAAKAIEGNGITFETSALDDIKETIEKGREYGIDWE